MVDLELLTSYYRLTDVLINNLSTQGKGGYVGLINSNEGKFIYKIVGSWKTKEEVEDNLTALEFVNQLTQTISPALLRTRQELKFIQIQDKIVYVLQYIEGQKVEESEENYFTLGVQLARMHSLNGKLPNTHFESDKIKKSLLTKSDNYSFKKDLKSILKCIPSFQDVPKVLIHCDPALSNCIKTHEKNLILVDWDEIGIGPSVVDLGALLIQQFVTEDCIFNEEYAKSFYSGYNSVRKLSHLEVENIFWSGLLRACFYLQFGDEQKRWKRILWSLENRSLLEKVFTCLDLDQLS